MTGSQTFIARLGCFQNLPALDATMNTDNSGNIEFDICRSYGTFAALEAMLVRLTIAHAPLPAGFRHRHFGLAYFRIQLYKVRSNVDGKFLW
jgi:hypothetical protein